MAASVLQLTDLHLSADPAMRLWGVPTRDSLAEVLEHARRFEGHIDRVVLTGDLSHDEGLPAYQALRESLGDWTERCAAVPGNHDDRDAMRTAFADSAALGAPALTFSLAIGAWRLIGLDSLVPGEDWGRIDADQRQWLRDELSAHQGSPTLLCLHHPPVVSGCRWMDAMSLQGPALLRDVVAASPQVRGILAGHVHHVLTGQLAHAPVLTAPATSVQFDPRAEVPCGEHLPPGYRILRLNDDGTFESQVVRLPTLTYPPDR